MEINRIGNKNCWIKNGFQNWRFFNRGCLLILGDHLFLNCIFFGGRRRLINNGLLINPDLTLLTMYWPGSWRIGEPAQGHVAGSISASFFLFFLVFFSLKKLSQLRGAEPATRRYVALSQLRGTEPATWHWASKVALSFELARRQWASKVALSFIIIYIYIYIYLCNPNHIIY